MTKKSKGLRVAVVLVGLLVAYLFAWPTSVQPVAWQAPESIGYQGSFETNHRLADFEKLSTGDMSGPEAAIEMPDGSVVAATHEGWLVRWPAGELVAQPWVEVGGRPLGLVLAKDGAIWIANAYLGLMRLSAGGELQTVLTEVDGKPLLYADDLDIAPNGKIYFSDASTRFGAEANGGTLNASVLDLLEHSATGRLIEYDPSADQSRVVMDGLSFANGVAVDASGDFLLLAETGAYRVWKVWLNGQREPEVLINNLPGFPDNVHQGKDGRFWVGLTSPRSKPIDDLSDKPFLRRMIARLPEAFRPKPQLYGLVFAMNGDGQVLLNLQSPNGKVYTTTGVLETKDALYVSSLTAPFLAKYSKAELISASN